MSTPLVMHSKESDAYRKYVWESMLDGEMNDRYWRYQAAKYAQREKTVKMFLALTSSGTVMGWAMALSVPIVWQVLSGISALLALALPIVDFTGQVERASDLRQQWWGLTKGYSQLWAEIELGGVTSISQRIEALRERETEMARIEAKYFSRDETLLKKCQAEVLKARGLSKAG